MGILDFFRGNRSAELLPAEREPEQKIMPFDAELEVKNDPNIDTRVQFFNVGQPRYRPRNYQAFAQEGYKKDPTVYKSINLVSRIAAGIKWKAYADETLKREIENHPLLDLWKRPNPKRARTRFIKDAFLFWQIAGNCYIYANRPGKNAPPSELWLLRPDRVTVVPGATEVQEYRYGVNPQNAVVYPPENILHLTFTNPDDDWYGLSPLEVGAPLIDQQNDGNGWATALMQNAGRPSGALVYQQALRLERLMEIEREIDRRTSGKRNAGRPLVLDGGASYIEMGKMPLDMDWKGLREMNKRDLASIHDVGPELAGDSAGKTFANVHEAIQFLYTEKVLPMLDEFQDELNLWLPPMYGGGIYLAYDRNDIEALQENREQATTRATSGWTVGTMTFNESRKMMGLDEIPGGDVVKWGAAFVPVDQLEEYAEQALLARMAGLQNAVLGAQSPNPAQNDTPGQQNQAPGSQAQQPPQQGNGNGTNASNGNTSNQSGGDAGHSRGGKSLHPRGKQSLNDAREAIGLERVEDVLPIQHAQELDQKSAWQTQRDQDIEDQLDEYAANGVTHIRWECDGNPCPVCLQNNHELVEAGDSFPSGDLAPPIHPNCLCTLQTYSIGERGKAQEDALEELKLIELDQDDIPQVAQQTEHKSNREILRDFIARYA